MPIPRIEPVLENWQTPYTGVDGLRVHVFNTGALSPPRAAVYEGGGWFKKQRLDILAFVIERPDGELIVFDTGMSPEVAGDAEAYMGWLLTALDKPEMQAGQDLPTQMRAAGFDPAAVQTVVLSHLHFDHTGTLSAFPNATVVVGAAEREAAAGDGLAHLPFVDSDFAAVADWRELDFSRGEPYATFASHINLLADGSIKAVSLSGHTAGSLGLVLLTKGAPLLLTGDAAWVEENWRYAARPIHAWSMRLWWEQIWRIKKFTQLVPSAVIVAGHDAPFVAKSQFAPLVYHPFDAGDVEDSGDDAEASDPSQSAESAAGSEADSLAD